VKKRWELEGRQRAAHAHISYGQQGTVYILTRRIAQRAKQI